ncbi:MAG: replicative DNA helicase [Candidatus Scalindua sp. AMX11]|nr:MAG: replicative DNA helicase [Candidatus Scalindua sp.]NOG85276.1 replicative DNA helicase [Planctomycetota bacterium]RZV81505.1 MAG: replicative DNA helicase [Candidatus Scalindua sp. SCAELEC01]TDE65422.1 MAG: replicative DNA helicase [Candidatus Scalindua sp. AMX11]GJQ59344.1 MAG: replicative DNA helicase [Candidatus Scalindua sp.]
MSNALIQEKVQPYSMEAEISVLGSMLIDNETIGLVAQVLSEKSFYKTAHIHIYEAIINLYDKQRVVDLVILKDELFKRSLLDKVGGVEYLMELEESVPITANVEFYAKIVREKAIKRELIAATTNIQQKAYHESLESDELLDLAERSIFDITQQKLSHPTTKLYEILNNTFDRLEILHERESKLTGLSTGFYDLDDITSGLQDSELIIVAARPSMGKTSFTLNLAENVGANEKKATVIFSMEMAAQQVAQNMLCSHAKIDAHLMRTGKLDDNQWSKLPLSMGVLSEAAIFIDETPGLSVLELRAKARRLKAQHDIQLIIIDYLQLMEGRGGESRQQEISVISRGLKALARELKIPVIAVSQLNRSVETREGHKPRISDLRESGSIEQDADVIMLLHRDDYYDPSKNPGMVELNVAKQRNGPVGKIALTFLRQFLRFENCNTDVSLDEY